MTDAMPESLPPEREVQRDASMRPVPRNPVEDQITIVAALEKLILFCRQAANDFEAPERHASLGHLRTALDYEQRMLHRMQGMNATMGAAMRLHPPNKSSPGLVVRHVAYPARHRPEGR